MTYSLSQWQHKFVYAIIQRCIILRKVDLKWNVVSFGKIFQKVTYGSIKICILMFKHWTDFKCFIAENGEFKPTNHMYFMMWIHVSFILPELILITENVKCERRQSHKNMAIKLQNSKKKKDHKKWFLLWDIFSLSTIHCTHGLL